MKNVSAGKYIPGNSLIHRLDPRVKIISNILMIVLVFLTDSFITEALLLTPILVAFLISGLRKRMIFKLIKPALFIGVFIFLINIFIIKWTPNSNDVWAHFDMRWWKVWVSYQATSQTLLIMLRIFIMIFATTLLTSTTKPMALSKGIEDLLTPLKLIKVPTHIIAMIISIALRFIPTLIEETQRIMKAQASRGVDFKNGGIKSKAKSIITLIIPLFVSAFAKAEDLGNAMETRGYNPYEKRTRYRHFKIRWFDVILTLAMLGALAAIILTDISEIILPTWWV